MSTKPRKGAGAAPKKAAHATRKDKKKPPPKKSVKSPPNKGGAPLGSRNAAKYKLPELPEIHRQLIAHLETGKGWDTFPHMSRQSIMHHFARNLPEFPEAPVRAAFRRGVGKLEDVAMLTAMGKMPGNARLLAFLLRNKGLSDRPEDPNAEQLPTTDQKPEQQGVVIPPRVVVVFEDAKPPEEAPSDP